ncbi:MAG TPA: FixH family protein [Mucilaginibacter sp.]|nr:FixH family protein [Mucilaginibacter sp.]
MNWGKGIILGMSLFMLFIMGMCVKMFSVHPDEYDHQYYEKGLHFDQDFNKEKQVVTDNARPVISIENGKVSIAFVQPAAGVIKFVRPANAMLDKKFALDTHNGKIAQVPTKTMADGRWRIVLDWTSDKKAYLYQQEVYIK